MKRSSSTRKRKPPVRKSPAPWWNFTGEDETFEARDPDRISRLYFPLTNDAGFFSAITPALNGDVKTDYNHFLTLPVSTEDLHNTRSARQFWTYIEGRGPWSATAPKPLETCHLKAGALWHEMTRANARIGLQSKVLNFVPMGAPVEIMRVELTNIGRKPLSLTPTAAIPLFGRSAANLRDHRHVTSLLHRISLREHGLLVIPTMSFDERGHQPNTTVYAVWGCEQDGAAPVGQFPTVPSFIGEGGNFDAPQAILENQAPPVLTEVQLQGREAVGALRFKSRNLAPGRSLVYLIFMGIAGDPKEATEWLRAYGTDEKVQKALAQCKAYWKARLDQIKIETGDKNFDRWLRWVTIQPMLRRAFGNSFLPDFDYGKGGRGWRDLWQDTLSLLLMDPGGVRSMLLNNFGGVRLNGTNATIIGRRPGEFIADRNNISRVWMDHGAWPWITTELYLHQTGDLKFLLEEAPYFEDRPSGAPPRGTVLEHLLIQHLAAAKDRGAHGNCRLLDADWNDGLDMARERGESVAFTALYAGNLQRIARTLAELRDRLGVREIALTSILGMPKNIDALAAELKKIGDGLARQVRDHEWIKTPAGDAWFNGYYDNNGNRVEGEFPEGVRMTLTGQVFPIMCGVATEDQVRKSLSAAKKYLQDKKLGGFRLNTDFGPKPPPLGRAFAFAYGEKENGAFFSHMVVMLANALYQRGFVPEGYEVLNSIYRMHNAEAAKIYPGIPEYFNGEGRGLYHYLTGSASWYLLTLITEALGIRGRWGDLELAPRLMPEQFDSSGQVVTEIGFAGKRLRITYLNRGKKPYGLYRIESLHVQGKSRPVTSAGHVAIVIPREDLLQIQSSKVEILVKLA